MATKGTIARDQAVAIDRIIAQMERVSNQMGIEPAPLPTRSKYGEAVLQNERLTIIGEWLEQVVNAMDSGESNTLERARYLAKQNATKADIIAELLGDD